MINERGPKQSCDSQDEAILPQAGQEHRVEQLIKSLKSYDIRERRIAADELVFTGPEAKAAVPTLIEVVKEGGAGERWHVQHAALRIFIELGPEAKAAVPILIYTIKDSDIHIRKKAAEALEAIGVEAKAAIPALIEARKDQDIGVRNAANNALRAMMPWWSRLLIR